MRTPTLAASVAAAVAAVTLTACGTTAAAPVSSTPAASASPGGISSDLVRPSARPVTLRKAPRALNVTYTYDGHQYSLDDFLARSKTEGFVVLDGEGQKIVYERYLQQASASTRFQSWSMAKSFTSAAVGIALGEGRIRSINDPVTRYLPELRGSGYNGVSIRDVLRMSSGIAWNEDTDDIRLQLSANRGLPLTKMAARQVRGWEPGTKFNYTSMNYFVLGWLVSRVTGMPYYRFVESQIWKPAGMASTAYIENDTHGDSTGYCCYYATDRDFARFGLLYLRSGRANGRQVEPRSWVGLSTKPSSSFAQDYGLGWWLGGGDQANFMAAGLGGQYIYVSPRDNVVIADSARNGPSAARSMQKEALTAFQAVAAEVAKTR